MTTAFWWFGIAGIALLLLAAGTFVALNFSEQVYVPLLSALVIGVLTFTITFVSSLKSTAEETTFATSVVEDTRGHLPVFVNPDPAGSAISLRASELGVVARGRSEEHTSELQSRPHLVCRLLLEKKKILAYKIFSCRQFHL